MSRHDFDPLSFLFGALFVVVGLLLLGGRTDALPMDWAGPVAAVIAAVVIVIAARRGRPTDDHLSASDES